MAKKIGILTFHRAHNYGAVLQAYALQEYIKGIGFDVDIIDYRQPYIEREYKLFLLKRIRSKNPVGILKKLILEIKSLKKRKRTKLGYERFLSEHLNISKAIAHSPNEIPSDYDFYIHGSDQIWNPKMVGGTLDPVYFGAYSVNSGKRISYAASFMNGALSDSLQNAFRSNLANLDSVSVREKDLIPIISNIVDKPIYDVLDPTLLADAEIWKKIIIEPQVDDYILIYQVGINPLTYQIANKLAEKYNLKIYDINTIPDYVDVGLFVGLFYKAKYVVTTSFHGTAFSLIFQKPFYTIASGTGRDVRMASLLDELGIRNRMVKEIPDTIHDIDYKLVTSNFELLKDRSKEFLRKELCSQ